MSEHTPGPWYVNDNPDSMMWDISITECVPEDWDNTFRGFIAHLSQTNQINTNEQQANARLIAAAPDMLEALQRIAGTAELILDGDDLSGMNDRQLFGGILEIINAACP